MTLRNMERSSKCDEQMAVILYIYKTMNYPRVTVQWSNNNYNCIFQYFIYILEKNDYIDILLLL